MYRYLILLSVLLTGCSQTGSPGKSRLQDTLAKLKLLADFKPLKQTDAYIFLNDYYLPGLDSQPIKRKIFIHPLTGRNFKDLFEYQKKILEVKYSGDSLKKVVPDVILLPPPQGRFDLNFTWDSHRLIKTSVVTDIYSLGLMQSHRSGSMKEAEAWRKAFGYGYMCISYPVYNKYTNRLTMNQWIEDGSSCGTGRDSQLWFKRTNNSWVLLKH